MRHDEILSLLPYEIQREGNGENIKKILKVYSDILSVNDNESVKYGNMLDIYSAVGTGLDFIGNMYSVFRETGEKDDIYRDRIINTIINRKTPTTIPELQQAIDSIVVNGRIFIRENHSDRPASVYLTGTAGEEGVSRSLGLVRQFLPAGVGLYVPVVSFETWQQINDQFTSWESLSDEGYIW